MGYGDKLNKLTSPHVWVFIAQMVEHCSPNAGVMGVNSIEVSNFFQI